MFMACATYFQGRFAEVRLPPNSMKLQLIFPAEPIYSHLLPVHDSRRQHNCKPRSHDLPLIPPELRQLPLPNLHFVGLELRNIYHSCVIYNHVPRQCGSLFGVHFVQRIRRRSQHRILSEWCLCIRQYLRWNLHPSHHDVCSPLSSPENHALTLDIM